MSIEMTAWALGVPGIPAAEKLVLIGIASHADRNGDNAWPSIATLAGYANVSERQAKRLVKTLAERGVISIDVQGGGNARTRDDRRPNLYRIETMNGDMRLFDGVTPTTPRDERGDTQRADGVTSSAPRGDTAMSPEPSLNHPVEPSADTSPAFDAFWSEYPRKIDKAAARRAWKSATKQTTEGDILGGLVQWKLAWVAAETAPEYIPHPTTWLNRHRWESTPDIGTAAKTGADPLADAIRQHLAASGIDVESRMDDRERADFDARLTKAITAVSRMGYDDGEILLRAALVAKHDWTDLVDPIMYARRNEVARFRGMPKPQVEGETVLDAMRRTRNIGRWVQS